MSAELPPPPDGSAAPASPAPTSIRWPLLIAAYVSLFALGISDNVRGPLFPQILRDLDLGDAAGSWMFAITAGGVILGSLGMRPVVARHSAGAVLVLCLGLMAAGLAGMSGSGGLAFLLAASLVLGVGLGGLALGQNLLVENAVPPALQRRAFSGLHSMYGVASLLAPTLVAGCKHFGVGWRSVVLGLAAPVLLVAWASWLLTRRAPRPPQPAGEASAAPLGLGALSIAGLTGCCVVAELLLSTRIPLLLQREGLDPELADLHLSGFFACLLAGRLFVTIFPLRRVSSRALLATSILAALACYALGLAYEPRLLPLAALGLAPCFPVATSLLAEDHRESMERGMSVLMALASVLLILAHSGVGALTEEVGLRRALWVGVVSLGGALSLLAVNAWRAARTRAG